MALEIKCRSYCEADKSFVMATMLRGIYHGCQPYALTPRQAFFEHHAPVLVAALANAFLHVRVAHDAADPELILGYIVTTARTNALVWCYVKSAFRKQGIATKLMGTQEFPCCTNITAIGNEIRIKKGLLFMPWSN